MAFQYDPIGLMIGQGLAEGLHSGFERRREEKDKAIWDAWINSYMQTAPSGPNDPLGIRAQQPLVPPSFRSEKYQQYADMLRQQQMQSMMPMSPLDQARMRMFDAQARRDEAYGQSLMAPPSMEYEKTPWWARPGIASSGLGQALVEADIASRFPETDPRHYINSSPEEARRFARIAGGTEARATSLTPKNQRLTKVYDALDKLEREGKANSDEYNQLMKRARELEGGGVSQTVNIGGKSMTEGQIQRLADKQALLDIGKKILDMWNPSMTGPIQGRWLALRNTTGPISVNESAFYAGVTSMLQNMYSRAGKQLSDEEIAKWAGFLPKVTDPDNTFKGKMNNLMADVSTYLESEIRAGRAAGYYMPQSDWENTTQGVSNWGPMPLGSQPLLGGSALAPTQQQGARPTRTVGGTIYEQQEDGRWYPRD